MMSRWIVMCHHRLPEQRKECKSYRSKLLHWHWHFLYIPTHCILWGKKFYTIIFQSIFIRLRNYLHGRLLTQHIPFKRTFKVGKTETDRGENNSRLIESHDFSASFHHVASCCCCCCYCCCCCCLYFQTGFGTKVQTVSFRQCGCTLAEHE